MSRSERIQHIFRDLHRRTNMVGLAELAIEQDFKRRKRRGDHVSVAVYQMESPVQLAMLDDTIVFFEAYAIRYGWLEAMFDGVLNGRGSILVPSTDNDGLVIILDRLVGNRWFSKIKLYLKAR